MQEAGKFVSVVIPVLNEERYIRECIGSVLEQDYPRELLEVILVDGMSEDATQAIIGEYSAEYPFIRMLENPGRTVQLALNIGMRAAQGEYIVRMDAHSEYATDYISRCIEYLEKTGADNVGGPMIAKGKTTKQRAVAAAYHSPFALGGGRFHIPDYEGYADTVFLGAFRHDTLRALDYYDEKLPRSEDDDLNFRLTKAGGTVYITPKIRCVYYPRGDYRSLFKQYFEYGVWKVAVIRKHRRPARISHLVPVSFLLFLVLGGILSCIFPLLAIPYGAILLLYLLLDALYSFRNPFIQGFGNRLRLMWVHFVLHISYGAGFFCGIFRFLLFGGREFSQKKQK